jgi:hypothetical protein
LLAAAFLGSYLGLDPEKLCRDALRRFEARFRAMEAAVGKPLRGLSLHAMTAAWEKAKRDVP